MVFFNLRGERLFVKVGRDFILLQGESRRFMRSDFTLRIGLVHFLVVVCADGGGGMGGGC